VIKSTGSFLDMLMQIGEVMFMIGSQTPATFSSIWLHLLYGHAENKTVSLSSTEAKYIALAEASQELPWIKRILKDFNQDTVEPATVYEDNQSCNKMLESNSANQRM